MWDSMDAGETRTQMRLADLTAEYERGIHEAKLAVQIAAHARRLARGAARLLKVPQAA